MVEFGNVSISAEGRTVADCLDDGWEMTGHRETERSSRDRAMDMRREDVRLRTFRHWPRDWASALARLGFISVSADSECLVQCAFCGQTIEDFSSPDEASLKHWQRAREVCRYLQGQDVGNVPLPQENTPADPPSTTSQTIPLYSGAAVLEHTRLVQAQAGIPNEPGCRRLRPETQSRIPKPSPTLSFTEPNPGSVRSSHPACKQHLDSYCEGSVKQQKRGETKSTRTVHWKELVRTARYPDMVTFQDRLNTLRRWPLIKPSPTELAKAGFFHVKCPSTPGQQSPRECWRDSVQCFWCGERIHRWQPSDDAVVEHARLSPHCLFVLQLLGQQVCDDILSNVSAATTAASAAPPAHHHQESHHHPQQRQPHHQNHQQQHKQQHHHQQQVSGDRRSREELDDLMRSPQVQTVLQMGFPPQLIRSILSRNSQLLSTDTLCTLALQAAEETSRVFSTSPATNSPSVGQSVFPSSPSPSATSLLPSFASPASQHNNGQRCCGGDEMEYLKSVQLPGEKDNHFQTSAACSRKAHGSNTNANNVKREREEEARKGDGESRRRKRGVLMCQVCSEAEVSVVFRPCNHLVCCSQCMAYFTSCPLCEQIIQDICTVNVTS